MRSEILAGLVRILRPDGSTSGAGFLASSEGLIVTCSHVICSKGDKTRPGRVPVVFLPTGDQHEAEVEKYSDASEEDVAVLRIKGNLPPGAKPLLLGSSAGTSGHRFKTFGFPEVRSDEGLWGYGTIGDSIVDERGRPLLQLTGTTEVTPGFSGAPILDIETRRVVGMATAILTKDRWGRLGETAIATPAETIEAVCPNLKRSDICPYKSLRSFTESDSEFFFGRNKIIERLIEDIRSQPRFLAVFGPSGSGKSSLIQAGFITMLKQGLIPGSDRWGIITIRPSDHPFENLEREGVPGASQGLVNAASKWLENHSENERLLLILDQFEEVLTNCSEDLRRFFMKQLTELLDSNLAITVMLVMRSDFFSRLDQEAPSGLIKWVERGFISVPSTLELEELKDIVQKPAERVGLLFEEGLVNLIVDDVMETTCEKGRPTGRSTILPLLESALTELWRESQKRGSGLLTHEAYNAIGGVTGGLTQWADKAFYSLDAEVRPLAARVLTDLVHLGNETEGLPDTKRRRSLTSLGKDKAETDSVHSIVQKLADARLLVTSSDEQSRQMTVEIIHDSLIREWKSLRDWLREDRNFLAWRQGLEERTKAWMDTSLQDAAQRDEGRLMRGRDLLEAEKWLDERGDYLTQSELEFIQAGLTLREKEEKAKKRLRRQIIAGLAIGLIITSTLGLSSYVLWQDTKSHQMATQAELMRTQQASLLQYSVLLAAESLNRSYSLEADQTLRRGLALLPRPVANVIHSDWVNMVVFSPDGRYIATASDDGTSKVYEIRSGREAANLSQGNPINAIAFSPRGDRIATVGNDGSIKLWNAYNYEEIYERIENSSLNSLCFSPGGELLVTGGKDGVAKLWDVANGKEVAQLKHNGSINGIVFSSNGEYIASAGDDHTAKVWELSGNNDISLVSNLSFYYSPKSVTFSPDCMYLAVTCSDDNVAHVFEAPYGIWSPNGPHAISNLTHADTVNAVAFSPDSKSLATASEDMTARIWDIKSGKEAVRMAHEWGVKDVAFSPDGRYLATSSYDNTARVWESAKGWEVARMIHDGYVVDVTFSPNGKFLATASMDNTAKAWEIPRINSTRIDHNSYVNEVVLSPDGKYIATASKDGTSHLLDMTNLSEIRPIKHNSCVNDVAFSPDGKHLATACKDGAVGVYDIDGGKEISHIELADSVENVVFNPDGEILATASDDNTARLWLWNHYPPIETKRINHTWFVNHVAFSIDGRYFATAGMDGKAKVWDMVEDRQIANISHDDLVWDIAFSRDGRYLVTASDDGTAKVLDLVSGQIRSYEEHTGAVNAVSFSPDSNYIATASDDGTVRIWGASNGKTKALMAHGNRVYDVAFSPDGNFIATASDDNTARVWEINSAKEVALFVHNGGVKRVLFSKDGDYIVTASDDGTARVFQWKKDFDPIVQVFSHVTHSIKDPKLQRYL